MRINIVQYSPTRDVRANYDKVRDLVDPSADMVVLPELSDHGYFVDRAFLEEADTTFFPLMLKALSKELHTILVFGAAEKEEGRFFNSLYCMEDGWLSGVYRKMHLTDYEKRTFSSGSGTRLFSLNCGLRLAPSICFDLWFPEVYRDAFLKEADLFVTISAFGGPKSLDIACSRAAENSIPMVLANRSGVEELEGKAEPFLGRSRFISYFGDVLKEAREKEEDSISYDLPLSRRNSNVICSDMKEEILRHYLK